MTPGRLLSDQVFRQLGGLTCVRMFRAVFVPANSLLKKTLTFFGFFIVCHNVLFYLFIPVMSIFLFVMCHFGTFSATSLSDG